MAQANQARRIIDLFGGVAKFLAAMEGTGVKLDRTTPYHWMWPRSKRGAGGRIPSHRIDQIKRAGRHVGLLITEETFFGSES